MATIIGCSNRILEVDLQKKTMITYMVPEGLRRQYLGAKGLGLKLLYDRMTPGVDPLGPQNFIAFMPGVLMGTGAPCSGRFEAITKSPLTGIMVASSCGGPFGMSLKTAGWDGLIITGRADTPTYLDITDQGVVFKDAAFLWGKEIPDVQAVLDSKASKSLVIGPAGENGVRFANMAAGHRFLGRGGIGAVMGAKNLKAIVATGGSFSVKPHDPVRFKRLCKKATRYINQNPLSADRYRNFGTSANVAPCNKAMILPVNNFQDGRHDAAKNVFGETMAKDHETVHHTCKPCTIRCGHKGRFAGKEMSAPEYETIGLLGTSLGIFDLDLIAQWNQVCGRLGMDTISAGATLAWVMEAASKGLVKSDLAFGTAAGIEQALEDMAFMRGFGAQMAMGTRALSEKHGGREFAIQVKGLEMAAYDPRGSFGQGLAYAVANRGACHLSAYMVAQEVYLKLLKPDSAFGKAKWVKFFEDLTCCINSLQTCQFTMFAFLLEPPLSKYTPRPLLAILMQYLPDLAIRLIDVSLYLGLWNAVTGIRLSTKEFLQAGERIHVLERLMNTREGIDSKDDVLPLRFLVRGRASDGQKKVVPLDKMRAQYYRVRKYDEKGIPRTEKLKQLEIL
ncbi:MAG: aldehyde ferredoxin oxidoreductase family protein [Proteobacteria bacterium]|nr:aldehyde ferredoxin oxidoreductase family protein [Desulfobacula sp.]MBU3954738.1 aldehyde ferredoxin oxidoreductase family protein [Pseudomonadota bacterium]MBU4132537.1 aldehyde ferredoxin oxidoreductase family protein [Pseudomonadota bacterium]